MSCVSVEVFSHQSFEKCHLLLFSTPIVDGGNDAIVVGAVVVVVVFACDIISSAESAEVRFAAAVGVE